MDEVQEVQEAANRTMQIVRRAWLAERRTHARLVGIPSVSRRAISYPDSAYV